MKTLIRSSLLWLCAGLLLSSCGSSVKQMPGPTADPNESRASSAAPPSPVTPSPGAPSAPQSPGHASTGDAPQISTSVGVPGGAVVLWPRIVLPTNAPGPDDALNKAALAVQSRLAKISSDVVGRRNVNLRPAPQRACPQAGCKAMSVGALLTRAGKGCAVMALVSRPGRSPATIVPWAGRIRLDSNPVPFRDHPEKYVHVDDYVRCDDLGPAMTENQNAVVAAVKAARN